MLDFGPAFVATRKHFESSSTVDTECYTLKLPTYRGRNNNNRNKCFTFLFKVDLHYGSSWFCKEIRILIAHLYKAAIITPNCLHLDITWQKVNLNMAQKK